MRIHWVDLLIFIAYLTAMLGVGVYFFNKNKSKEDYYVGGRKMSASHVGLSVVATDVGGGFSIGLGGLGFVMGISGSWMLFTGLLGAWLSAVFLIPKVYKIGKINRLLSFPELLANKYNASVALIAGIISLIGYVGFTSSQILAGAKLASATFPSVEIKDAVLIMGVIAVLYTVVGGIKAVIYTDTIQWILLLSGLILIGIPFGYIKIGGWEVIQSTLPNEFFSLSNITFIRLFNWAITILPIWFVGMTLYQRIYACRVEKTARKAWVVAGLFEWPVMAFMGVVLGLFSRVAYEQGVFAVLGFDSGVNLDPELGLPLFLSSILPVGLMGLMMSAYFSAIMSTADSCLMAASGNFTTDILGALRSKKNQKGMLISQVSTLVIGVMAILLATVMQNVLELMLYSYAFMVSGLFVPVLGLLILKRPSPVAALSAMLVGGMTTLVLILIGVKLPYGLDANFFGISLSALAFIFVQFVSNIRRKKESQ
jgi:SSS family solute:Na+ symporter